jgi:hypothetical protein
MAEHKQTSVADELDVAKDVYAAISGIDADAAGRVCAWAVCRRKEELRREAMREVVGEMKAAVSEFIRGDEYPRPKPS